MNLEKILCFGKKAVLTWAVVSSLLFGCKKENSEKPDNNSNEIVLSPNTRILTEQNLQEINYFDGNEIKFNSSYNSPILSENTFIVGSVSEKTPEGILKKVTGVFDDGHSAYLTNANLGDAIESGEIRFKKNLKPSDLKLSKLEKGVRLKESLWNYDFEYDLFNVIIYDLDGNETTTNDQIRTNGKIYLNANFELNFDFGKQTASFKSGLETLTRIELDAELTNYNIEEEKLIAEHKFKPIIFFIPSTTFPIILTPVFDLYAKANGEINAEAHAVVEQTNTLTASINYNEGWNYSKDFTKNFIFETPNTYLNADITTSLGPKLDVLLYGFIGPSVEISPYLKLHVNTNENPWLNLFGGIDGKISINSSVIGMGISDYEKEIINYEEKLLELFNSGNIFTDPRDGQEYKIVKIGDQEMFAENLNYNSSNSYYYNNDPSYSENGRLYNWSSANSVCPIGWHLPSDDEFKELEIFLGMSLEEANQKGTNRGANENVGTKLKEGGISGFDGILAGHRTSTGNYLNFGYNGYFWTSTKTGDNPFNRILWKDLTGVERDDYILEGNYFSVRCFKDE